MNTRILLLLLIIEVACLFNFVRPWKTSYQCAGENNNISCDMNEKILVGNVYYGSTQNFSKCHVDITDNCNRRIIHQPTDAGSHCNGRQFCSYTVPSIIVLPCNNTLKAQATRVDYKCIPSQDILDVCITKSWKNSTIYLISPGYPSGIQNVVNCHCKASGTKMTVMILELSSFTKGDVVFNIIGNERQQQITGTEKMFEKIFSDMSSIKIDLRRINNVTNLSKFWLQIDSETDINMQCGEPQSTPSTTNSESTTSSSMTTQQRGTVNTSISTDGSTATSMSSTATSMSSTTTDTSSNKTTITTSSNFTANRLTTTDVTVSFNSTTTTDFTVSINSTTTTDVTVNINTTTNTDQSEITSTKAAAQKSSDGPTGAVDTSVSTSIAAMQGNKVDDVGLYVGVGSAVLVVIAIIIVVVVCFRRKSSDKQQQQQPQSPTGSLKQQESEDIYSTVNKISRKSEKWSMAGSPVPPLKTESAYIVAETSSLAGSSINVDPDICNQKSKQAAVLNQSIDSTDLYSTIDIDRNTAAGRNISANSSIKKSKPGKYVVIISLGKGDQDSIITTENPCYESYDGSTIGSRDSNNTEAMTENPCYKY